MDFNQVKFPKMYLSTTVLILAVTVLGIRAKDDIDFNNDNSEIMIAQESRQYSSHAKSAIKIIKPNGVTNSHRPQYNIDSEEEYITLNHRADLNSFYKEDKPPKADNVRAEPKNDLKKEETKPDETKKDKQYNPSYKLRSKEGTIRDAVLRALERKDHIGKFAQILPIIRSMSGSQRGALASLVASQVTTPMDRKPLNLAQVRSMFGNNNITTDLMLPILLDTANLIRRANKHGKQTREVKPQNIQQISRRSDTDIDDEPFETYEDDTATTTAKTTTTTKTAKTTTVKPQNRVRRVRPNNTQNQNKHADNLTVDTTKVNNTENTIDTGDAKDDKNSSRRSLQSSTTELSPFSSSITPNSSASSPRDTKDLTADSTQPSANQTLEESPIAEQLRASQNRYVGKGNLRRGAFPKPSPPGTRRTTAEPSMTPIIRKRPSSPVARKPQSTTAPDGQCEMFTNSLCLHSEDYPTDAIVLSIRRNKAAAGALLADFQEPKDGAVDGVSAAQEAKYTAEHYLESNRRGDTANRDFAGAGEAGFMCPSIVKYARPQRARATSGQWKYIVNTGEHTQTLRLEKCLKPKEACTYLTDNFKSKCVQVYNYHRLLTWDQQNGLHMDIFKVPTCCSCHIEGYSVNFPPLGHRVQETSSESFPEDIPSDHGNSAFEAVQPSVQRPKVVKNPPPFLMKPLETFPSLSETHNHINTGFPSSKIIDTDFESSQIPTGPIDSYGSSYFPDSFNQGSSNRIVKRPGRKPGSSNHGTVTLPSYLEPPTPANPSSFSFIKETPSKYKITSSSQYKRGAPRPSRRPIRKKLSGAPDDLVPAGTSIAESFTSANIETLEDFNDDLEEPEHVQQRPTIAPKLQGVSTEPAVVSSTRKAVEQKQQKHDKGGAKDAPDNKRVNYNYHPIIDFFEEGNKEPGEEAMDRDDSLAEYVPALDSEWTPINHPVSRNTQNNLLSRKKH